MQMLHLATLVALTLASLADPDRCCYPPQAHYTGTILSGVHSAAGDSVTEGLQVNDYDVKMKIASTLMDISYAGGKLKTHTIIDYGHKMTYDIDLMKNTCTKIANDGIMMYCIPPNATYLESGVMGALDEAIKFNTWKLPIKLPSGEMQSSDFTVSNSRCAPISASGGGVISGTAYFTMTKFVNETDTADQGAFSIPDICDKPVLHLDELPTHVARVARDTLRAVFG